MEKLIGSIFIVISAIAISYLILRYWNKKLLSDFNSQESNLSFSLFAALQILAIFFSIFSSFDLQTLQIFQALEPFYYTDYKLYWSFIGILVVGVVLSYLFSVFLSLILYKSAIISNKEFKENINEGNVAIAALSGVMILSICVSLCYFSLRPILNDWITSTLSYTPLN